MKILYAIQGTGNGHISRAREIIPILKKYCQTDILISGYQADVNLPYKIDYRFRGLSFIFGKKGGIDLWNTYFEAQILNLRKEIDIVPVEKYDLVINDFEPVSAWACYQKKIPCLALSHQAAVLHNNAPTPQIQDLFGKFILKNYAPSSAQLGFHFEKYAANIFTPVIRNEIRNAIVKDQGFYTVYLPAYTDEKIVKLLSQQQSVQWKVFSKHTKTKTTLGNINIYPINNEHFIDSLKNSTGLFCGAGFEGPAEALFLQKKLLVVPMKVQYEQLCNAAALKNMGVPILKNLRNDNLIKIRNWVENEQNIEVNYPDITEQIIQSIFEGDLLDTLKVTTWKTKFDLKFPKKKPLHKVLQL